MYMLKLLGKVDCVTVSGDKHKPCVFPVLWKGEYRDECIEQGSTGKHWCATELKSTGAYSKFGHCSDSCPREGKEKLSIRWREYFEINEIIYIKMDLKSV